MYYKIPIFFFSSLTILINATVRSLTSIMKVVRLKSSGKNLLIGYIYILNKFFRGFILCNFQTLNLIIKLCFQFVSVQPIALENKLNC